MRVISGIYKRRRFDVPHSFKARPTTDFAKENLFNVLSNYMDFEDGIRALDLFAGTGSISIELVSRGCDQVISVEKDRDLQIAREDIAMMKQRIKDNKLSLNKKIREQENSALEERRKSINKERKIRFAEMAREDATKYKIYRLTLDDVNAKELPLADPEKDNEQFMHLAEDPTAELDDSPEYPSGLDPELREGINIVQDMLKLESSGK